jgi:phage/conjugal plasmid C-4 type zinc finger TraR family protein
MIDSVDQAQALEEEQREDALRRHARLRVHGDSAEDCIACGFSIPEARRIAVPGVQTCVFCQTKIERTGGV